MNTRQGNLGNSYPWILGSVGLSLICSPWFCFSRITWEAFKNWGLSEYAASSNIAFLFFPKRYQRGAGVSWLQPANTPFLWLLAKWVSSSLGAVWSALKSIPSNPLLLFQLEVLQAWPRSCEVPGSPGFPGPGKMDAADTERGAPCECTHGHPSFFLHLRGSKEARLATTLKQLFRTQWYHR